MIPDRWDKETYQSFIGLLTSFADQKYKAFQQKLIPNADNMLGVRLPILRGLARKIAKGDYRGYLRLAGRDLFEEVMLAGMVIGYIKADIKEVLDLTASFVPKIDNWAVCDSFCAGLKIASQNQPVVFEFLQGFLRSDNEFKKRFSLVMLLYYFIDETYIDRVLSIYASVKSQDYYVQTAAAWGLSMCFVKFAKKTLATLKNDVKDEVIFSKAIQKIIESRRVDADTKAQLRLMRRKRRHL